MRVKKTPTGVVYILFLLLVSGAAVNTGNNTLYVTAATMMGVLIFSGLVNTINLSSFTVEQVRGGEFYANRPGRLYLLIQNRSKRVMVQGLYLNDKPLPPLDRGGEIRTPLEMTFARRGRINGVTVVVTSCYPFGFFTRKREIHLRVDLLVYPEVEPTHRCDALLWRGEGKKASTVNRVGERAFKGLKTFQEGDDPRAIHWKKSAQKQMLITREFRFLHSGYLIYRIPPGLSVTTFETHLKHLTYCILQSLREGRAIGVEHGDHLIEPGSGPAHRLRVLSYFALVQP